VVVNRLIFLVILCVGFFSVAYVDDFLTDDQLRASNIGVNSAQSGAWNINSIVNPVATTQSGAWSISLTGGTNGLALFSEQQLQTARLISADISTAAINLKTPALGQALAASSVPVVLTASQLTTLTPLSSISINNTPNVTFTNSTIGVSGTFFQATQPVSLATIPLATNAATDRTTAAAPFAFRLSDGAAFYDARQIRALTSADVTSVVQSGSWNVGITGTPTVTANIGTVGTLATDTSVNSLLKPASTLAAVTTVGAVTSITNPVSVTGTFFQATQPISAATLPLPIGATTLVEQQLQTTSLQLIDDILGTVAAGVAGIKSALVGAVFNTTLPTLTNGQQAALQIDSRGRLITSENSFRVQKVYSLAYTGTVAEGILTLIPYTDHVAGAGATTHAVTAGRKLKITTICVVTRNAGAAVQGTVINLRINSAGAAVLASPIMATVAAGSKLAIANNADAVCNNMDSGIELSATNQFAITQVGTATANNIVTVIGYEY
jgi:hypothetical protein